MKQALDRVVQFALDPVVRLKWCVNYANTDNRGRTSFIMNTADRKTLGSRHPAE
jgi:hypothetical protein